MLRIFYFLGQLSLLTSVSYQITGQRKRSSSNLEVAMQRSEQNNNSLELRATCFQIRKITRQQRNRKNVENLQNMIGVSEMPLLTSGVI